MMRKFVVFSGLVAVAATAQESTAPAVENPVIGQIIVTATRREASVTDVPLAVSAYGAERLELSRVTDIMELMRIAPSFHIAGGQAESVGVTARIRGVGTNSDNPGFESSVGMYIDGVYRNRATVGLTELGAIERVEVLRGPQGTLFGRNSSAGVVSITIAPPDPDGTGYADLSFGSYGASRVEAGISGALGQNAAARLDAVWFERDGLMDDINYDRSFNNRDRRFIRGQIEFEPSDTVRVRVVGDYTDRDENCCAAVGLIAGPTTPAVNQIAQLLTGDPSTVGTTFDPYAREAAVTKTSGYDQSVEEGGISLEIDADLPAFRLVSVTATRDWETARQMDIDFSAMDLGERPEGGSRMGFETFTQEIRLNGQNGPLDWLVGAYYSDEFLPYTDTLVFGPGYGVYADGVATEVASSIGPAFGQLAASLPPLDAGARLVAEGAAGFAAGIAPHAALLPPGLDVPTLGAALPMYPGFPYSPWPGYERVSGASFLGSRAEDSYEQDSQSLALFTHNSLALPNDFDMTIGLRYTSEEKAMVANLDSTEQVCARFGQRFLGDLQAQQAYLGGVGAYAQELQAYLTDLNGFVAGLQQAAPLLPPQLAPLLAQLEHGAAGIQGGAAQLLPGLSSVISGGQTILSNPDVQNGFGMIGAFGCSPFADSTKNGRYAGGIDENEVSGTLRLSRSVGDHLLYGGYARGYKAGGFNMDRSGLTSRVLTALTGAPVAPSIDQWAFNAETVDSFEIGGKFSLDGWRGMLDVSLFHEAFQDYQLTAFRGFAFEALNVPEVVSEGVEIEARGVVNSVLEIFGGLTYADVRFGDGPEHGFRAGQQLTHAPKVTGVGGITLRFPLGPLAGRFHIDARYTGEHNTGADLDAQKLQDAYTMVNARLTLSGMGSESWTLDFWGQNVTDAEYAMTIFDAPLQTGTYNAFLGDPPVYGVSVRYEF